MDYADYINRSHANAQQRTDLQCLLRLLSASLQMHRLTSTAYDVVRKPRRVLLVIKTAPENRGGDR